MRRVDRRGIERPKVERRRVERRRVGWQNVKMRRVERLVGVGERGGFRAEEGQEVDGGEAEVREAGDERRKVERLRVSWQRVKPERWRRRVAEAREVGV